jgi:hypothetical protein
MKVGIIRGMFFPDVTVEQELGHSSFVAVTVTLGFFESCRKVLTAKRRGVKRYYEVP